MRKKTARFAAFLLTVIMVLNIAPVSFLSAGATDDESETVSLNFTPPQEDDIFSYTLDRDSRTAGITGWSSRNSSQKANQVVPESTTIGGTAYTVTSIQDYAFRNDQNIQTLTVQAHQLKIGDYAFDGCGNLTEAEADYTGSDGVITIGSYSFSNCGKLENFNSANGIDKIGNKAFYNDGSLKKLTAGSSRETSIDYWNAFQSAAGELFFNGGLADVPNYTFYTSKVTKITTSSLGFWALGDYFAYESKTTPEIVLNLSNPIDTLAYMPDYGFWLMRNAPGKVTINLNGGVKSIENGAFYYVPMKDETHINIAANSDGSMVIREGAIPDNANLYVYIDLNKDDVTGSEILDKLTGSHIRYRDSVNPGEGETVQADNGIFTLDIDTGERKAVITGLSPSYEGDGNISVPASVVYDERSYKVQEIRENAFADESRISTVSFDNGNSSIAVHQLVFSNMPNLTSVSGEGLLSLADEEHSPFAGCPELASLSIRISDAGSIAESNPKLTEVTLAATGDLTLSNDSFRDQESLESLTIRAADSNGGKLTVNGQCFSGSPNLKTFVCEMQESSVAGGAFSGCTQLETVVFTGRNGQNISSGAFADATGIRTLRLDNPYNVQSGAFAAGSGTWFVQDNDAPLNGNLSEKIGSFENYIYLNNPWWMSSGALSGSSAPKKVYFANPGHNLSRDAIGAIRNAGSNLTDVYIDCDRTDVSFADELDSANGNVRIHYRENTSVSGIFLDGVDGEPYGTADGTTEHPYRSYEDVKKALANADENEFGASVSVADTAMTETVRAACAATGATAQPGTFTDIIRYEPVVSIINTVTVSGTETWDSGSGDSITIYRDPDFKDEMVKVTGTLTLENVTLDGNRSNVTAEAPIISAWNGAVLNISDGATLQNNAYPQSAWVGNEWQNGGAVYAEHATVNVLPGSTITGNTAMYGGGIQMAGGTLNMTGGTISGNSAVAARYNSITANGCGGGVLLTQQATMNLSGGSIANNSALEVTSHGIGISGSTGGGIQVGASYNDLAGGSQLFMTGGTVSGNKAHAEAGGIYINGNCTATITGGSIINNESGSGDFGGGGIYVNAVRTQGKNGLLKLYNVLISNNDAPYGGGIACCETVNMSIYMGRGSAIFDNTSRYGGDIHVFLRQTGVGTKAVIATHMMNGSPYNWTYRDGTKVPTDLLAYFFAGRWSDTDFVSHPDNKSVSASVIISGNRAKTKGGGIGSNGDIVIGDVPPSNQVTWTPEVDKIVYGRDLKEGERITFTVYEEHGTGSYWNMTYSEDTVVGTGYVEGAKDGEPAGIVFTPINLGTRGASDIGKLTRTFLVMEDPSDNPNLVTDKQNYYAFYVTIGVQQVNGKDQYVASTQILQKGTYTRDEEGKVHYELYYGNRGQRDREDIRAYYEEKVTAKVDPFKNYLLDREAEVIKIWTDDGKPVEAPEGASIKVSLLADGKPATDLDGNPVLPIVLDGTADTDGTGRTVTVGETEAWKAHWENLPIFSDENYTTRITYTVTESEVLPASYVPDPENSVLTAGKDEPAVLVNKHEATEATVKKVWDDDGNREGMRPESIRMTLTANGNAVQQVTLSDENGWTETVRELPVNADGKPIQYEWTEQEIVNYRQTDVQTTGTETTFTNRVIRVKEELPPDEPQPELPKGGWHPETIEEYATALGGDSLINHTGDCFD